MSRPWVPEEAQWSICVPPSALQEPGGHLLCHLPFQVVVWELYHPPFSHQTLIQGLCLLGPGGCLLIFEMSSLGHKKDRGGHISRYGCCALSAGALLLSFSIGYFPLRRPSMLTPPCGPYLLCQEVSGSVLFEHLPPPLSVWHSRDRVPAVCLPESQALRRHHHL